MKRNNLIITLLILIIFALGGWIYHLKTQTPTVTPQEIKIGTQPGQKIVGNDSDAHGCKGSAGYSWCEMKSKCLRVWEENCPVDEATLKTQVMADLVNEHGDSVKSLNFTISKVEVNYAQGGISGQGGGGMWFAAKVNEIWKLVWDGNGVILCTDLTNYPNFPTDMIPECYDPTTQKSVTR